MEELLNNLLKDDEADEGYVRLSHSSRISFWSDGSLDPRDICLCER